MPSHPEAKKLWKQLRNPNCEDCPLHEEAQTVCLIGDGPVKSAKGMIIGEAPGFREEELHKPFAGPSGKLLDKTLESAGLDRGDFFLSNINKCRPPDNRTPKASEAQACRPYLDGELDAVDPRYILLTGNHALRLLKKSGIMKHRGEVFDFNGAKVLPTIHPAAVLRNPRNAPLLEADVQAFARLMKGLPQEVPPPKIFLVKNKQGLKKMIKAVMKATAIAYDIETQGLRPWQSDSGIATIAISTEPGVAYVLPVEHPEAPWANPKRVLRALGNALIYSGAKLIAHNALFDDLWLNFYGVPIRCTFDTMVAAHLLNENRLKGLKPLAQMLLGVDAWGIDTGDNYSVPIKRLARYNAKDTDYTLRLYYLLKAELQLPQNRRLARLFIKLLMPASHCLTDVVRNGMWVDIKRLEKNLITLNKKLDGLHRKLVKLVGHDANWNSPIQVAKILFDELDLDPIELTKGGAPSTKESVLLQLRHQSKVCNLILEWRKYVKYRGTYLEKFRDLRDHNDRIHPPYKLVGTVTGRLSSGKDEGSKKKDINIQQTPRDDFIRSTLGAPPGWVFVEADFSQIELRIAAHYAKDPEMLRIFNSGGDIHLATAVSVAGIPAERITKEQRKKAKGINFGYVFGMGWRKFIEYARDNYDVLVSEAESKVWRDTFFRNFAKLDPWHERQRRLARAYKQVSSIIGRVRHLPDIDSQDKEIRMEAERQAINSPVQGLASDMMLLAMVLLHPMMDPKEAMIVGSVHDSLLFQIRVDRWKYWVPRIKKVMENLPLKEKFGGELSVPVKVDITVGKRWGEGKEVQWKQTS